MLVSLDKKEKLARDNDRDIFVFCIWLQLKLKGKLDTLCSH